MSPAASAGLVKAPLIQYELDLFSVPPASAPESLLEPAAEPLAVRKAKAEAHHDAGITRYPEGSYSTLYDRLKKGMLLAAVRRGEFVGVYEVRSKRQFQAAFLPEHTYYSDCEPRVRTGPYNPVKAAFSDAFNCYHKQQGIPTIYEEYSPAWKAPNGRTIEQAYGWKPGHTATHPAGKWSGEL